MSKGTEVYRFEEGTLKTLILEELPEYQAQMHNLVQSDKQVLVRDKEGKVNVLLERNTSTEARAAKIDLALKFTLRNNPELHTDIVSVVRALTERVYGLMKETRKAPGESKK